MGRFTPIFVTIAVLAAAASSALGAKIYRNVKMGSLGSHAEIMNCLKPTEAEFVATNFKGMKDDCAAAAGVAGGKYPEDEATKSELKKNKLCFYECAMKKYGLVADGSFKVKDFVNEKFKSEYQNEFVDVFEKCLAKKGLTSAYNATSLSDGCLSMEKHSNCLKKAEQKICMEKVPMSTTTFAPSG